MEDFFEKLRKNVPSVEIDIRDTINSDWSEFHDELGLDSYASSERAIYELGDLLNDISNRYTAYATLMDIYNTRKENNIELLNFIQNGLISAIRPLVTREVEHLALFQFTHMKNISEIDIEQFIKKLKII